MGGEFDKWQVNQDPFDFVDAGNFSFNGIFTRNPADPTSTGLGYADLLLGLPNSWNVLSGPITGGRVWNLQLFIQDSYKIQAESNRERRCSLPESGGMDGRT